MKAIERDIVKAVELSNTCLDLVGPDWRKP